MRVTVPAPNLVYRGRHCHCVVGSAYATSSRRGLRFSRRIKVTVAGQPRHFACTQKSTAGDAAQHPAQGRWLPRWKALDCLPIASGDDRRRCQPNRIVVNLVCLPSLASILVKNNLASVLLFVNKKYLKLFSCIGDYYCIPLTYRVDKSEFRYRMTPQEEHHGCYYGTTSKTADWTA